MLSTASHKCLLCHENNSTQKNSHLIPKFFGNGIFAGATPRFGVAIDMRGSIRKVQDIQKEDFILCLDCEKGISIFESYCILRLNRFDELRYSSNFKYYKHGELEHFEFLELDIRIFNLFIYSIVWRVSISEKYAFEGFKLPFFEDEKLRYTIREYIAPSQTILFEKLNWLKTLPNHSHVIIRPNKILRPPNAMMTTTSRNEWLHEIHMIDYILFYITDKEQLVDGFKSIDNNNLEKNVRIGLSSVERWKEYNLDLIRSIKKSVNKY